MARILPILLILTGTFVPQAVLAHAHLRSASPAAGSSVSPAPPEVVLSFSETLEPKFSSIDVRDAKGVSVRSGETRPGERATDLRVGLKPLPPGTYKVIWRVLSVDTHRTNGSFTFRVGP
jgi:methionine-rich copper-binding protein CopC